VVGQVGHGKSTLVEYLMSGTGAVRESKIKGIIRAGGRPVV